MEELSQPAESRVTMSPVSGILIAIGIFMVYSGVQAIVAGLYAFWPMIQSGELDEIGSKAEELAFNGDALGLAGIIAGLFGIVVIVLISKTWKGNDYVLQLGLAKPSVRSILIWLGVVIALGVALEIIGNQFDLFETDFMERIWQNTTHYSWLFIAVCIMAPFFEELLFRGLFLDALDRTGMSMHASALISSVVFAVVHMQYDWSIMVAIIALGMILAYSRFFSRSLFVPIIIHFVNNTITFAFTYYELG